MPLDPAIIASAAQWESRYREEFARDRARADLLVVSFPKSGRTWHRVLLGLYLARLCGESPQGALHLEQLCRLAGAARTIYSHNGANFIDGLLPSNDVVASPELWRDRSVILLVRDPREILVSAYHHACFRKPIFSGPIAEFIRDPRTGIEKIMAAFARWQAQGHMASSFEVSSYRAMHQEPMSVLRQALQSMGLSAFDEEIAAEVVEASRFDTMREYERSNYFSSGRMKNFSGDPRAAKIREGRLGAFAPHLSEDDLAFIENALRSGGPAFESFY